MKLASVSVTAILVVTCLSVSCEAFAGKIFMANSQENAKASAHESPIQDRRTVLRTGAAVVAGFCLTNPAQAFDNRIGELFPQLKGKPYGASTPVPKGVGDGDALKTCPSSEEGCILVLCMPCATCGTDWHFCCKRWHARPPTVSALLCRRRTRSTISLRSSSARIQSRRWRIWWRQPRIIPRVRARSTEEVTPSFFAVRCLVFT